MANVKKKIIQKLDDQQRIEFAKQIEMLYEAAHADKGKVFVFSLLKGVATGLGIFLGGTLIVALLLWLLTLGGNLPFIGKLSKAAERSIQQTQDVSPSE